MRLKPLFDRILIMPDPRETQTKSGLLTIPEGVKSQEMAQYGVVVEVSEQTSKFFKTGDHIAYRKYSGVEFPITDQDTLRQTGMLLMLKLDEVLGIVDLDDSPQQPAVQTSSLLDSSGRPLEQ